MKHTIREQIRLQHAVAEATTHLEFIQKNQAKLDELGLKFSMWYDHCDFDNLNRPDLLKVLKAFPGIWDKEPGSTNAGGIHYTLREKVDGMLIRCYNGEVPPSCTVEERIEYKHIPAHDERVVIRVVKCPEPQASEATEQDDTMLCPDTNS